MLSILVLSENGEGYELAHRCAYEGNVVKFWIKNTKVSDDGKGYPQIINNIEDHLEGADVVLTTTGGLGGLGEEIRSFGKVVVGGMFQEILTSNSVLAECCELLGVKPACVVNHDSILFMGGFFNGTEFISRFEGVPYYRLLANNRGPVTSGMGALVWQPQDAKSLSTEIINGIIPLLKKHKCIGFVGIEIQLTDSSYEIVRFVTEYNNAYIPAIYECSFMNLTDKIFACTRDYIPQQIPNMLFGLSMRLCYYTDVDINIPEHIYKHFWPNNEEYSFGYISARGDTPKEARRRVFRTIKNIAHIDTIYRDDVGRTPLWDYLSDKKESACGSQD